VTRGPVVRYRRRTCGVSCNSIAQSRLSSFDWSSTDEQRRLLPGCGKGSLLPRKALERRYVAPPASRIAKIRPSTARAGEQREVRQALKATRGPVVLYRCRPCGVSCNSIAPESRSARRRAVAAAAWQRRRRGRRKLGGGEGWSGLHLTARKCSCGNTFERRTSDEAS